jgi:hypothetical protein
MTRRANKLLRDPQRGFPSALPFFILDTAGGLVILCGFVLLISLADPDTAPRGWFPTLGAIVSFGSGAFLSAFVWRRWQIRTHAKLSSIAWEGGETTARTLNVLALYAQEATIYDHIAMRHHRQAVAEADEKPEERRITSADLLMLDLRHRAERINEWVTLETLRTGREIPGGRARSEVDPDPEQNPPQEDPMKPGEGP